jgi:hypothetical protein
MIKVKNSIDGTKKEGLKWEPIRSKEEDSWK